MIFNIPISAGLASSACGFAALAKSLNNLFFWSLNLSSLSILARLGSGSACRSLWSGFVVWKSGTELFGMDSVGKPMPEKWPGLCLGILLISDKEKSISSRQAMELTVNTSPFYLLWKKTVASDLIKIINSIKYLNFELMGELVEHNSLSMHALMMSSNPAIIYHEPETILAIRTIWNARKSGLKLYFTQDAGPNLKLLFMKQDVDSVVKLFPNIQIIEPFLDVKYK